MTTDATTIPSVSDLQQAKKDVTDISTFVKSSADNFTDNYGGTRKTITGVTNDAELRVQQAVQNTGYYTVFNFTTGGTITARNQLVRDTSDGKLYKWGGDIPENGYVVPPTSTPTPEGENAWRYMADNLNSLSGLLDNSDLDNIYIRTVTLAEAQSEDAPVDTRYTLTDYDNASAIVVSAAHAGGYYYTTLPSGRKINLNFNINSAEGLNGNYLGLIYDSRGQTANQGTDNTIPLQAAIDLIKTKPVGLFGESTGGKLNLGFGGLLITSSLDLTNNAAVSISGLGKTKTNLFASSAFSDTYMLNMTGSNNCRNEIKGLRITTVGGSEGVIRSGVNAMGSTAGANQIDVKENWINNLQSIYFGVASDSSFKDNTAEYCRQFVNIDAGGSRDLDVSENVVYNCGNIGLPAPSDPLFYFNNVENLTIERNRVINDSASGPFDFGIYRLVNVHNFDIRNEKFNDTQSYVGTMFRFEGSAGRLSDVDIPRLTSRAIRATDCPHLEIDKVKINDEKLPQDDLGCSFVNCETLTIGTLTVGRTGTSNIVIDGSTTVTIDTLILNGASNTDAIGGGFDNALKISNCANVSINKVVILQQSVGSHDIVIDATNNNVYIGVVQGTTAGRISSSATSSIINNIQP